MVPGHTLLGPEMDGGVTGTVSCTEMGKQVGALFPQEETEETQMFPTTPA